MVVAINQWRLFFAEAQMTDERKPEDTENGSENSEYDTTSEESVEVANFSGTSVGSVKTEVEIKQGGCGNLEAQNVNISQGGAIVIQSAHMNSTQSGAGIIRSEETILQDSRVGIVIGDNATITSSQAGLLIANEVKSDSIKTGILLAGKVEGPVETYLDTPRTILAGLSAGVAVGLVLFVGQLLSKRNK